MRADRVAHAAVAKAKLAGQLEAAACELCGGHETVAHHDDYLRPLHVRWLCNKHHRAWHSQHGPGQNQLSEVAGTSPTPTELRFSCRFSELDQDNLAEVMRYLGVRHTVTAVRYALHQVARQIRPGVK